MLLLANQAFHVSCSRVRYKVYHDSTTCAQAAANCRTSLHESTESPATTSLLDTTPLTVRDQTRIQFIV
eukprot:4514105-Amphidinium_carterae.1